MDLIRQLLSKVFVPVRPCSCVACTEALWMTSQSRPAPSAGADLYS